jgi:adenylate cyclase
VPSIRQQQPSAVSQSPIAPWQSGNGSAAGLAASVYGSFYNDSSEDVSQSPGFRPGSGRDEMGYPSDDRRPSVASATTVSSTGSKSSISRGFHKRLQGFFGEEFPGDSRQNSDASIQMPSAPYAPDSASLRTGRNRNNSVNNTMSSSIGSRPSSPAGSRPRTPLPSSEVTPWEYQESFRVCFPQVLAFSRSPLPFALLFSATDVTAL